MRSVICSNKCATTGAAYFAAVVWTPTVEPELFNKELLLAFISHRYYLLAIINWWRYYEITNIYHEKCSLLGIMKTMIRKKLYWLASNI